MWAKNTTLSTKTWGIHYHPDKNSRQQKQSISQCKVDTSNFRHRNRGRRRQPPSNQTSLNIRSFTEFHQTEPSFLWKPNNTRSFWGKIWPFSPNGLLKRPHHCNSTTSLHLCFQNYMSKASYIFQIKKHSTKIQLEYPNIPGKKIS